jgi:hypothetical protein
MIRRVSRSLAVTLVSLVGYLCVLCVPGGETIFPLLLEVARSARGRLTFGAPAQHATRAEAGGLPVTDRELAVDQHVADPR